MWTFLIAVLKISEREGLKMADSGYTNNGNSSVGEIIYFFKFFQKVYNWLGQHYHINIYIYYMFIYNTLVF